MSPESQIQRKVHQLARQKKRGQSLVQQGIQAENAKDEPGNDQMSADGGLLWRGRPALGVPCMGRGPVRPWVRATIDQGPQGEKSIARLLWSIVPASLGIWRAFMAALARYSRAMDGVESRIVIINQFVRGSAPVSANIVAVEIPAPSRI